MPTQQNLDLHRWALIGAEQRLVQLAEEPQRFTGRSRSCVRKAGEAPVYRMAMRDRTAGVEGGAECLQPLAKPLASA
jgi:hypothetical protein